MNSSQCSVISKITPLTDVWHKEKQKLDGVNFDRSQTVNCEVSHLSAVIDWPQRVRRKGEKGGKGEQKEIKEEKET